MEEQNFIQHFGNTVRKYRMILGLTQEELGARITYDRKTINRIEHGDTDVKLSTIYHLSNGLETSCSRLFRDLEKNIDEPLAATIEYDYRRLFEYCKQLSPEQFNVICNAAHLYAKANNELAWKNR